MRFGLKADRPFIAEFSTSDIMTMIDVRPSRSKPLYCLRNRSNYGATLVCLKCRLPISLAALFSLLLTCAVNSFAAQVTLEWEANSEAQVGGYMLYYGQTSGNYAKVVDVGNQTNYVVSDLNPGETYYFAVTAYDPSKQNESSFSPEVRASIPLPVPAPMARFKVALVNNRKTLTVVFTDISKGKINRWNWNFGDGATSTSRYPSHRYTAPGTYTASLTVTGPGGSNTFTNTFQLIWHKGQKT
ncbi:MAG: PKD domain-containing protein [Deltaproteobacteria bacterium]|nr:PKD domain-containing protein [Deltaproteobacteria bacterium]